MSSSSGSEYTFASWFCSLSGNEYFCEVDEEYLLDRFNSHGLQDVVPNYDKCMDYLKGPPIDDFTDDVSVYEQKALVPKSLEPVCMLYGLIHARYILSTRGQQKMIRKYRSFEFGVCNMYNCNGQPYLPVGLSDQPRASSVKLYCPKCENIYIPRSKRFTAVDGAYFGTTFPHLLLMVNPDLRPISNKTVYVPKIFDFKIHPSGMQIQYEAGSKKSDTKRI